MRSRLRCRIRPEGSGSLGTLRSALTGASGAKVVRFGHGFVDWSCLAKAQKSIDFDHPISFHSEYSGETVIDLCRIDVRFFDGAYNAAE